jgi:hypothetical protein
MSAIAQMLVQAHQNQAGTKVKIFLSLHNQKYPLRPEIE